MGLGNQFRVSNNKILLSHQRIVSSSKLHYFEIETSLEGVARVEDSFQK